MPETNETHPSVKSIDSDSLLAALRQHFPTPFTLIITSTGNGNLALHLPDNRHVNHLFDDISSLIKPPPFAH